MTTYELKTQE